MLPLSDEGVLLEYFGVTGFVTLKEENKVYLVDSRFHKFEFLFPHITYLTTLKLYDITETNARVPIQVENKGINEILKQAGIFGGMLGIIMYGNNVLPMPVNILRWVAIIMSILIYLYKYLDHTLFMKNLGGKYNFKYSDLKVIKAKVRYVNSDDQRSYESQVLGFCCMDMMIIALCIYGLFQKNGLMILSTVILWWAFFSFFPSSKLMEGKKHLEFVN